MVDGKLQKFGDCDDKQQSQVLKDLDDKLEKRNRAFGNEVIFVVDGSGSVGTADFAIVRKWLIDATKALIEKYGVAIRTEVLQYSDREPVWSSTSVRDTDVFEIPYTLNDDLSLEEIERRIMNMKYLNSQTYTYYALTRVMEIEFPRSRYYGTSNKFVVVLTDGEASDALFLKDWYNKYKDDVTSIVIGIGASKGSAFYNDLQKIANGGISDERMILLADFTAMEAMETLTNNLVLLIETALKIDGR